jgi:hypothetical protein
MPVMTSDEIKEIVSTGADRLGIVIPEPILKEVANLSSGFPHYAHLLGLSIAKACLVRETKGVDRRLFHLACHLAIEDAIETFRQIFSKATKTSKISRYPQVLCACGLASHDENGIFRATDVVEAMQLFGEELTVPAVVPALQAFTAEDRGPVLIKVPFGSQNHYRFKDPMMRPFLKIKASTLVEEK